ncbi:hypothetical protein N7501_009879 [Penicillium viridicatum]|nr:hypothetical protein N7501_009879 [Penicillium viridicatum]
MNGCWRFYLRNAPQPHIRDLSSRQDATECLKYASSMPLCKRKTTTTGGTNPSTFAVGDKLLLRIRRDYNIPMNDAISRKLGQQYAGLFTVVERVGRLAYKLQLPPA